MGSACCPHVDHTFALQHIKNSNNPLVKSLTVPEEPEKDSLGNFIVGKWTSAPKKDGQGIIYSYSFYYEGQIKNGMASGKGKIYWDDADKPTYEGEFLNNKPHRKGAFKNNSFQFVGDWNEGDPTNGRLILDGKDYRVNDVKLKQNNKAFAKIRMPDKSTYQGELLFQGSCFIFHGQGEMIFPDDSNYSGEWKNGKMDGKGKYEWKKQRIIYDGHYKDGMKDGQGKYYLQKNKFLEGTWEKGLKHGQFKVKELCNNKELVVYECNFQYDKKE